MVFMARRTAGPVIPAGSYQLTVTAASTTVQASPPVTLNVQ